MSKVFETSLQQLAGWFQRQSRILPWRENPDTYRVWVSEIMLQQTQVITVIPYFEKFISRFPTVRVLAEAPLEEVLLHWAGLGYYSRARNLHRGAQMIQSIAQGGEKARAKFPRDREGWLEIPGVGDYTAGAILSISLNQPEAILDGNVERVISRLRRVSREGLTQFKGTRSGGTQYNATQYKDRLWRLSRAFVVRANDLGIEPRVTNQALMELGATVCTPKNPKCLLCPLSKLCRAHQHSEEGLFPTKKKSKEWLEVKEEVHCFIDGDGRVLLRQRTQGEWRAGLWDLLGELPEDVKKNLRPTYVGEVHSKHVVTRHKISRLTKIWRAEQKSKKTLLTAAEPGMESPRLKSGDSGVQLKWVSPEKPGVALGSALKKTLSQIRETFPEVWPTN